MLAEEPYLIYPISDFDDDPEDLIGFYGVTPYALRDEGHERYRALVTIAFFELDSGRRAKTLFRQRAVKICSLYSFLTLREEADNDADRAMYQQLIDVFTSPSLEHTSCARSFRDLYEEDRAEADAVFELAGDYLASISD